MRGGSRGEGLRGAGDAVVGRPWPEASSSSRRGGHLGAYTVRDRRGQDAEADDAVLFIRLEKPLPRP